MSERDIDELLRETPTGPALDPALVDRIAGSLRSSLSPVRPLPASWILVSALFFTCAAVAAAGAAWLGFFGIEKLSLLARILIFLLLALLVWSAAMEFVGEMIPGTPRWISPRGLLVASGLALAAIFAMLFQDYRTINFFSAGIVCLGQGLGHAIPAALAAWWILRRGVAVNRESAALAAGLLGGLCGITMLEFHCPNFELLHVVVWHIAVLFVSGALGWIVGRTIGEPSRRQGKLVRE